MRFASRITTGVKDKFESVPPTVPHDACCRVHDDQPDTQPREVPWVLDSFKIRQAMHFAEVCLVHTLPQYGPDCHELPVD